MPYSSFLHASSAKAVTSSTRDREINNGTKVGNPSCLRLLLVEEEPGHSTHEESPLHPKLAFSLIMESALAVVASSKLTCRGCTKSNDSNIRSCKCCKVALLIPGETKKSRKRKANRDSNANYNSSVIGTAGKLDFPLMCHPETNSSFTMNNQRTVWDENLLNQIHIKYVNSLSDLIKYLAYAPSLPDHLQPLDGIFVLGLGDLLSRDSSAPGLTEMTHACKS